jgi:hypothetical protein
MNQLLSRMNMGLTISIGIQSARLAWKAWTSHCSYKAGHILPAPFQIQDPSEELSLERHENQPTVVELDSNPLFRHSLPSERNFPVLEVSSVNYDLLPPAEHQCQQRSGAERVSTSSTPCSSPSKTHLNGHSDRFRSYDHETAGTMTVNPTHVTALYSRRAEARCLSKDPIVSVYRRTAERHNPSKPLPLPMQNQILVRPRQSRRGLGLICSDFRSTSSLDVVYEDNEPC